MAPFESFDLSIPGGSFADDESALPVTPANDSVWTETGFAGEFGSLSTGNSVIVPAARCGMSALAVRQVYVFGARHNTASRSCHHDEADKDQAAIINLLQPFL